MTNHNSLNEMKEEKPEFNIQYQQINLQKIKIFVVNEMVSVTHITWVIIATRYTCRISYSFDGKSLDP